MRGRLRRNSGFLRLTWLSVNCNQGILETKFSDSVNYNCEDVVKRAVASVKSEKRFLSVTLQPEAHDPDQPVVADMWNCQLKSAWTNQV